MPERNPEDRVRIKNIVKIEEDDVQSFRRIKLRREVIRLQDGTEGSREREYEEPFEWNFRKGFCWAWGGVWYWMEPGEERTMYRFLAEHAAEKMVDYLLNREYLATKRVDTDGVPHYAGNILQNAQKKEKLLNQIILGTEQWAEPDTESFDAKLAAQFGGGFDDQVGPKVDMRDVSIDEVDQGSKADPRTERKAVPPTDNPELKAAREEADLYEIIYTAADSAKMIRDRIVKAMA